MTDPAWLQLRNAVHAKKFADAASLLGFRPALVHMLNNTGETVLHYLAVENDIEGVEWLHERGFDLNTKNAFGTPLVFEVAQLRYLPLLRWLKSAGADFGVVDADSYGLIEHLVENDPKPGLRDFIAAIRDFA